MSSQLLKRGKKLPSNSFLKSKASLNAKNKLRDWFLSVRRDLPWRKNLSPYAVWVSEIMLQQTQVSVVIPYYNRWMKRFPTIAALAAAPLTEVIKLWEGLGYYSRARNLHQAARSLNGELPRDPKELAKIKGLGPYTIGAICSFAFQMRAAAVDGNVMRVMSRYLALEDDISKSKTRHKITAAVEGFLPDEKPWEVMEALIELGATICRRKPNCANCPLASTCQAFAQNVQDILPINSRKTKITHLHRYVALIISQDHLLLRQGKQGEIMADLYELPYFEEKGPITTLVEKHLGLETKLLSALPETTHSFTRYRAHLFPWLLTTKEPIAIPDYQWIPCAKVQELPFSSGHRKILQNEAIFLND